MAFVISTVLLIQDYDLMLVQTQVQDIQKLLLIQAKKNINGAPLLPAIL